MYYQQLYTAKELSAMLTAAGFATVRLLDAAELSEYRSNRGHLLVMAR
jgi:hypothetical protein